MIYFTRDYAVNFLTNYYLHAIDHIYPHDLLVELQKLAL